MSYRAFKRLLGETSLERQCRFLFGAFILLLIAVSFMIYGGRMESLAYEQLRSASRVLSHEVVDRRIAAVCRPTTARKDAPPTRPEDRPAPAPADEPKETK